MISVTAVFLYTTSSIAPLVSYIMCQPHIVANILIIYTKPSIVSEKSLLDGEIITEGSVRHMACYSEWATYGAFCKWRAISKMAGDGFIHEFVFTHDDTMQFSWDIISQLNTLRKSYNCPLVAGTLNQDNEKRGLCDYLDGRSIFCTTKTVQEAVARSVEVPIEHLKHDGVAMSFLTGGPHATFKYKMDRDPVKSEVTYLETLHYFMEGGSPGISATPIIKGRFCPAGNLKRLTSLSGHTCFVYWDRGYACMPPMLQTIYNHNVAMGAKYGFRVLLIDDTTVANFFTVPDRYYRVAPNFRSDIVRFHMLHLYGGIWLDTDGILVGDLNVLWADFVSSDKLVILDVEVGKKLGCAALVMKADTICSAFCLNHVLSVLHNYPEELLLKWDFLGPTTVTLLARVYPDRILVHDEAFVKQGANYISWADAPGFRKEKWLFPNADKAKTVAAKLLSNTNCFYVLTWTIYSRNNVADVGELNDLVFNNEKSLWYHLVRDSLTKQGPSSFSRGAHIDIPK